MTTWIGADWDSEKCVVGWMVDGTLRSAAVARHPSAVAEFLQGVADPVVGIESGDRLWAALWRLAGAQVYVFDACKAKRYAESFTSSGARDDGRSARALLSMVQSKTHRDAAATAECSTAVRIIRRLLRRAVQTGEDVVTAENRLRDHLHQVHPAFEVAAGRSLRQAWCLRALHAGPTPADWCALPSDARAEALSGSSKAMRGQYDEALSESWNALDELERPAVGHHIRCLVASLQSALERDKSAKAAVEAAVNDHDKAEVLIGIKGIAGHLAAAILGAFSDAPDGDRDEAAVAMGAAPVTQRSGCKGDQQPLVQMRRAAAPMFRRASYLLGRQLVQHHAWARAQYEAYKASGKRTAAAYRRVVRSFLRIVRALLRTGEPFDEDRYVRALRCRRVEWAFKVPLHAERAHEPAIT